MAIRHINPYGRVEYLDRPLSDCSCKGSEGARRRESRNEGCGRRRGRIAKGIASAAIVVNGALAEPRQDSDTTEQHFGQSSLLREGGRQVGYMNDATRDRGSRDRGTHLDD